MRVIVGEDEGDRHRPVDTKDMKFPNGGEPENAQRPLLKAGDPRWSFCLPGPLQALWACAAMADPLVGSVPGLHPVA